MGISKDGLKGKVHRLMTDMPSIEEVAMRFPSRCVWETRRKEGERGRKQERKRELSRSQDGLQPRAASHYGTKVVDLVSGCGSAAAESRQPSAIQKPRGPADGRRWLCITACARIVREAT